MKGTTKRLHDKFATLGQNLGLVTEYEVSTSLLSLRLDKGYSPRIDVLWSLPLDKFKQNAIAEVTKLDIALLTHLPVVGIEVENSDPSTKTIMADVANLRILGTPLGLIVVSTGNYTDLYRRAARAIRTLRFNFGNTCIIPFEASWLDDFSKRKWNKTPGSDREPTTKIARGGESHEWTSETRQWLKDLGTKAGFIVADPYDLEIPKDRFRLEKARRKQVLKEMWNPITREMREIKKGEQYMTGSQIDLAWLLPLPPQLQDFVKNLSEKDPTLVEHDVVFPDALKWLPAVGFELEASRGKHGAGGLLNLAAYCSIGVCLTPDSETARRLVAAKHTYSAALGLKNIYVRKR